LFPKALERSHGVISKGPERLQKIANERMGSYWI